MPDHASLRDAEATLDKIAAAKELYDEGLHTLDQFLAQVAELLG